MTCDLHTLDLSLPIDDEMINLVKTELFGGAIVADFPKAFLDASYVVNRESRTGTFPIILT